MVGRTWCLIACHKKLLVLIACQKKLLVLPEMRAIRGRDRGLPETLRTEVVLLNRRVAAAFYAPGPLPVRNPQTRQFASASFHAVEVPTGEYASVAGPHAGRG